MMVSIYKYFVYSGALRLKNCNRNLSLGKTIYTSSVRNLVLVLDATFFTGQSGQKLQCLNQKSMSNAIEFCSSFLDT